MAFSYLSYNTCDFDYRIKTQAIRKTFILSRKQKKYWNKSVKDHFLLSGRGEAVPSQSESCERYGKADSRGKHADFGDNE